MLFSSGSVSRGPFLSHQAGYHYHSYSLGLVLKSTITIHEYTSHVYNLITHLQPPHTNSTLNTQLPCCLVVTRSSHLSLCRTIAKIAPRRSLVSTMLIMSHLHFRSTLCTGSYYIIDRFWIYQNTCKLSSLHKSLLETLTTLYTFFTQNFYHFRSQTFAEHFWLAERVTLTQ